MNNKLKKILVPIDFNNPSIKAAKYAYNLADRIHAEIILLHVIQTPGLIGDFFSKGDYLVKMTDLAKDKLMAIAKENEKEKKVASTCIVQRGKPYEVILNRAGENDVRMVILGENHQGVDANQDLGTTVYHVTLKSPAPVITLKGDVDYMKNDIVVPLDLTSKTRNQLFSALSYGMKYNAKIHLVSVLIGGIKMRESRIYKKLKKAKRTLDANGVDATIKLFPKTEERPFNKVLEYAREIDAGMILVMTHKEGYKYDNYIGAFAHHIINKSTVPVLSLTSVATNSDFSMIMPTFVDPLNLFNKTTDR